MSGTLHTFYDIVSQERLTEDQADSLRSQLHGKGAMLDEDGVIWYRMCDITAALQHVRDVNAYVLYFEKRAA